MAGQKDTERLYVANIDRALQKPVMPLFVPIDVLVPEIIILFCLFILIKFWVIVLLPLHYVLVLKSEDNHFWVKDLLANLTDVLFSSNSGLRGKKVITFLPFYVHQKKKSDILE